MPPLLQPLIRLVSLPWRVRNTPSQLALGMALGFAFGVLPKDNLIAVAIAVGMLLFPANLGMGAIAMGLGLITGPQFDSQTHTLGESLLHHASLHSFWGWYCNQPFLPWFGLHNTVVLGTSMALCLVSPMQFLFIRRTLRAWNRVILQKRADLALEKSKDYRYAMEAVRDRTHVPSLEQAILRLSLDDFVARDPANASLFHEGLQEVPTTQVPTTSDETSTPVLIETQVNQFDEQQIRIDSNGSQLAPKGSDIPSAERVFATVGQNAGTQKASASASQASNSQQLRPGLRLDLVDDSEGDDSKKESEETTAVGVPIAGTQLKLGDVLRETLIEVVRFRPSIKNQLGTQTVSDSRMNTLGGPKVESSRPLDDTARLSKENTPSMHSPSSPAPATNLHRSETTTHVATSNDSQEPASNPPPPQPVEESLRYLLWHLSSLNRESKQ